jgi:hypothetical protein
MNRRSSGPLARCSVAVGRSRGVREFVGGGRPVPERPREVRRAAASLESFRRFAHLFVEPDRPSVVPQFDVYG